MAGMAAFNIDVVQFRGDRVLICSISYSQVLPIVIHITLTDASWFAAGRNMGRVHVGPVQVLEFGLRRTSSRSRGSVHPCRDLSRSVWSANIFYEVHDLCLAGVIHYVTNTNNLDKQDQFSV